ncbi:MAG: NTP transferase domain-containing protein [Nitrospiraceae bacterium]|nr:NTP transferase domain-containing protein [Nitrospiraceae bacterium]
MKAVIMVAGKSTRTYPLTLTKPKPLLPVMNKPILAHQLDALKGTVDAAVLVVGYRQEMIREAFGDSYNGMALEYVEQREQLGTGHAVLQCAERLDEPFLAMNGDDLYAAEDFAAVAAAEQAALVMSVPDPRLYGVYEVGSDGRVVRIVEKPTDVFSNLANIGVYKFTPAVFDVLRRTEPSERGEIEITSAVQTLADEGDFRVVETQGYWLPIGYPWHLLTANAHFLNERHEPIVEGEVSPASHLSGAVSVGRGTVIRPGAVIEGPVCIGEDCTIGPNCFIRGNTSIGNGCRIGQGVEVKASILMEDVHAAHLTYIGDSVVGTGTNLGCGTVMANFRHDGANQRSMVNGQPIDTGRRKLGAILGDDVHTGINTSIYPGRKLWPGVCTRPGDIVSEDLCN